MLDGQFSHRFAVDRINKVGEHCLLVVLNEGCHIVNS